MKSIAKVLVLLVLATPALCGEFDNFEWRLGTLPAQGHYQVTLKINYTYDAKNGFDPSLLGLPMDPNLKMNRIVFKVDGKKVDHQVASLATWWSYGKSVPVYLPAVEGQKIKAEGFFVIKNLFLIPPAPTNLPVPIKKLSVGFAPVPGFDLTGSFIGETYKFKHQKLAHRVGDPPVLYHIKRRNIEPSNRQDYLFLIAKSFTFSFNNLRAAQWDPSQSNPTTGSGAGGSLATLFGGTGGYNAGAAGSGNQDTAAGHKGFSITGDLKPYSANFYKGNPSRDWQFALTWLQQERTYLPFGIQPGGAVKSRTLFNGAGDKTDDLIPWIDPAKKIAGDAVTDEDVEIPTNPDVSETKGLMDEIDLFVKEFRQNITIDHHSSALIASESEGKLSPAMANRDLANSLVNRFGVKAVPTLISVFPQDRIAALPLSAFSGVITAVQIGKNWFFVDAANSGWTLERSMLFLRGHSVVILDEGNVQIGAF